MSPKSLLRLPAATSPLEELTTGTFQRILDDREADPAQADRLLLCSGKIYYELVEERKKRGSSAAIVRFEELYPWHPELVGELVQRWSKAKDVVWVQDEPGNMGAAFFAAPRLERTLGRPVRVVARDDSASPATGSHKAHALEQDRILRATFEGAS